MELHETTDNSAIAIAARCHILEKRFCIIACVTNEMQNYKNVVYCAKNLRELFFFAQFKPAKLFFVEEVLHFIVSG